VSHGGTQAHLEQHSLPPLVRAAASSAAGLGFGESCLPAHGRLLALLTAGVGAGLIGETGTGGGVGAGHPALLACELPLAADTATLVARVLLHPAS
jgi:predicted O-methyltransferase YrrM